MPNKSSIFFFSPNNISHTHARSGVPEQKGAVVQALIQRSRFLGAADFYASNAHFKIYFMGAKFTWSSTEFTPKTRSMT